MCRWFDSAPRHHAVVAQLVERHLAKVEVASPSLVYRSITGVHLINVGCAPNVYGTIAKW